MKRRALVLATVLGVSLGVGVTVLSGTVAVGAPNCDDVGYEGSGTSANPYQVGNVSQLQCIEEQGPDGYYELTSDINASSTSSWNDGFDPIANDSEFTGSFDGDGHTVSGLTIARPAANETALFGRVGGDGTVENLTLADADITGQNQVGTVVGNNTGGTVRLVSASGTVSGENDVGGLVGRNSGTVNRSNASVAVESSGGSVGGLVGGNIAGSVTESYATGNVGKPSATSVGGLVGLSSAATVNESYATGTVTGDSYVGGLVGDVRTETGSTSVVERSYATGTVTGNTNVGGVVGGMAGATFSDESVLRESYFDELSTNQSSAVGFFVSYGTTVENNQGFNTSDGTGRATEMTGVDAPDNMTALDFTSTWNVVPDGYPVLAWQVENRKPTARNDSYTTTEETTLSISSPGLLENDDDPEEAALTVATTPVAGPSNGTVSLSDDGSFEYTPDDGFTGTDSFTYKLRNSDGGTDQATVTVTVQQSANYSVTITDTNGPVTAGEDVVVEATIENVGEAQGNQKVRFTVDGTPQATRTLSLNGSETATETFAYETSGGDTPAITASVASQNDTATAEVEINERPAPASFEVSNLDALSSATQGDTVQVSATIGNTGEKKATQTVTFSFDGNVMDSRDVTLASGARQQVSFSLDTTGVAPGTYPYGVSTEDDSETGQITVEEASEPVAENVLTIRGTGPAAQYTFSVTDDLAKSTANGANINGNDAVHREYAARGEVGTLADSYTFNGSLETIRVDGTAEVFLNGERLSGEEVATMPDSSIVVAGTGPAAGYSVAATGSESLQKITANNANRNANDDVSRTTATGEVGIAKDAYGFDGSIASLAVDGDANVYVNGRATDPASEQDHVITIVGTGPAASYEFTAGSDLDKSVANFANRNSNDEVAGNSASGEVGIASDSFVYNGDISTFDTGGDVTVYVDGERIDQERVADEA